jgi:hypothetical protein
MDVSDLDYDDLQREYLRLHNDIEEARPRIPGLCYERDTLRRTIAAMKDTSPERASSQTRLDQVEREILAFEDNESFGRQVMSLIEERIEEQRWREWRQQQGYGN